MDAGLILLGAVLGVGLSWGALRVAAKARILEAEDAFERELARITMLHRHQMQAVQRSLDYEHEANVIEELWQRRTQAVDGPKVFRLREHQR